MQRQECQESKPLQEGSWMQGCQGHQALVLPQISQPHSEEKDDTQLAFAIFRSKAQHAPQTRCS